MQWGMLAARAAQCGTVRLRPPRRSLVIACTPPSRLAQGVTAHAQSQITHQWCPGSADVICVSTARESRVKPVPLLELARIREASMRPPEQTPSQRRPARRWAGDSLRAATAAPSQSARAMLPSSFITALNAMPAFTPISGDRPGFSSVVECTRAITYIAATAQLLCGCSASCSIPGLRPSSLRATSLCAAVG
eukprot:4211038-Prymnesium_polylepis.1